MSEAPDVIWIDARLLRNFKTSPDPDLEASGVSQIGYIRVTKAAEVRKQAVAEAYEEQHPEQVIQLISEQSVDGILLLALTNRGRLFQHIGTDDWIPFPGPDLTIKALDS